MPTNEKRPRLRSQLWFDNPDNPGHDRALSRALSQLGLTQRRTAKRQADHRHRPDRQRPVAVQPPPLELANRVRDGIRDAGGIPLEFPMHPIQETGKRPTAALDRNLAYLGLSSSCTAICSMASCSPRAATRPRPRRIMAAATSHPGDRALGRADAQRLLEGRAGRLRHRGLVRAPAIGRRPHQLRGIPRFGGGLGAVVGHCNTMGTASTMNALAEALGLSLPGCAAIPAPYRERGQIAYETGRRAVEIVWEDLKPSDILTREAFENAIVACSAIGGSTNARSTSTPSRATRASRSTSVIGRRSATTCRCWSTAAGREISRRGILPRRRPAGGAA